ncbi:MAG: hypothetical protein AAFR87_20550 [Bacteroidota bacterium]
MNFPKEIPTNKAWKYAQTEWERTFLLKAPPLDISHLPFKQLEDNYLKHSQMRLRKAFDGTNTYFKLSKKVQLQSQSQQWVSSIYLNSTEYELFVHLPAYYLKKSRYYFRSEDGISIGLDHIKLKDKELWLANGRIAHIL